MSACVRACVRVSLPIKTNIDLTKIGPALAPKSSIRKHNIPRLDCTLMVT